MKKNTSLLCVKSIMTIILTIALVVLTFAHPADFKETFKACATMVVTFYFSHQINKKGDNNNENN